MLTLLAVEAEKWGTPLNEMEKKLLATEAKASKPIPELFRIRVRDLILRILEREETEGIANDPMSFSGSVE
ncbi:MAG TPA: hypothetical protein VKV95_10835 [Terriglobia bacterium]|nr:hypothetical protein [Terriglobia bacterium]